MTKERGGAKKSKSRLGVLAGRGGARLEVVLLDDVGDGGAKARP